MREEIRTERLVLTPLQVSDAADMVEVLADPALYEFTGGEPPSLQDLTSRYRAQVAGPSDGEELWYNWILRPVVGPVAVGFVQASLIGKEADLAWVVGTPWQGQGFATEAAAAMKVRLAETGTQHFEAHVHPGHTASHRVASAIGLSRTGEIDDDSEEIWAAQPTSR